jgi:hypothetical protein
MFLIRRSSPNLSDLSCDFVVLGSAGNVSTVTIQRLPQCTFPDHAKGNNVLCKHMLFILLKVMALDPQSKLIYQAAWIRSELESTFQQMEDRYRQVRVTVLAKESVRNKFAELLEKKRTAADPKDDDAAFGVARKQAEEGDDCFICFDALGTVNSGTTTYCRSPMCS